MELEGLYTCIYCFQTNTVAVDVDGGMKQDYVEDCQVCCRPNRLRVMIQPDLETVIIEAGEA